MAPKEKIEANADLVLWCVHVLGPDDIHAAPCHDAAVVRARELNEAIHSRRDSPRDILCFAYAAPWPHTPKSHADNLKQQEVDGSPPLHPRGEGGMKGYWSVTVRLDGDEVITIEPCMLAGRDINLDDESVIRTAAHHLLSFIGDPCPATQHREGG